MAEILHPDVRQMAKDLEKIKTNELPHIQQDINRLNKDRQDINRLNKEILKLKPRTTSFYLGILFIIFIIGISLLCLPISYAIGITVVSLLPLLMCSYAVYKLRK